MITNPSFKWMEGERDKFWINDPSYNSQVLKFGDNNFWITEQVNNDRGVYKVIADFSTVSGFQGWTRYYFKMANLRQEINASIASIEGQLFDTWIDKHCITRFICDHCVLYIYEPKTPTIFGNYAVFVRPYFDCEPNDSGYVFPASGDTSDYFVVDEPDCFPRFYYNREVAIDESISWIQRRGETVLKIVKR